MCVKERYRILGRRVLDAERARQADHDAAGAIAGGLRRAQPDMVVCRIHLEGRLAGREQRPAIQPRRLGSPPQLLGQHVRPDVLVNIDVQVAPPLISGPAARRAGWRKPPTEPVTEAVHLCVSVNRFSRRCVKGTDACGVVNAETATRLLSRRGELARWPRQLGWQRAGKP